MYFFQNETRDGLLLRFFSNKSCERKGPTKVRKNVEVLRCSEQYKTLRQGHINKLHLEVSAFNLKLTLRSTLVDVQDSR